MRLGNRWRVGTTPPQGLPQPVLDQIVSLEAELSDADRSSLSWTLTWLEGLPNVLLDGGPTVRYDPDLKIAYLSDQC